MCKQYEVGFQALIGVLQPLVRGTSESNLGKNFGRIKITFRICSEFFDLFQPVNMSVLRFTPERTDHNKNLLCQAENPDLANSAIQDSLILKVHCKLTKFLLLSVEK